LATPSELRAGRATAEHALIGRDDSALLVIDVQDYFLNKLPEAERGPLVARIGWLMRVARELDIPILATAEDVANDGPLVPELTALLPGDHPVFDKRVFGLYGQADIAAAARALRRGTFVLVGLETDICIAHSALGLLHAGYRVAVIEDACGSPAPNHAAGLRRLREAGVVVTNTKGIFYEWVRDLAVHGKVLGVIGREPPPGVTL
jgi:nicotinamidase-related amidase